MMSGIEKAFSIQQLKRHGRRECLDRVTVEEPLEIRVVTGAADRRRGRGLAITMRTPGRDIDLAAGFLFTEGIIRSWDQVVSAELCGPIEAGCVTPNTVVFELTPAQEFEFHHLQRHFYMTSSCGICGKASLEILERRDLKPVPCLSQIPFDMICELPSRMRTQQESFLRTGGMHAAALFNAAGKIEAICEDVGRHNALDKLVGQRLRENRLPASQSVLVVSGRASFELLQKALAAAIPIFVAVGAPSSLAIELAERFNITLVGFATEERCNIYSHPGRIA